jgi:methylamine utilization protein MauE
MLGVLCGAAALLLVVSGAAKLRSPEPAVLAAGALLRQRGSRRSRVAAVRVLASAELAVGVAFLFVGGRICAVLIAVAFAGLSAVALALATSGRRVSCGCFGSADAPAGFSHVVWNMACCTAGVACALRPVGALAGLSGVGAAVAFVGAAQLVLLASLGYLAMTAGPALSAARRALDHR